MTEDDSKRGKGSSGHPEPGSQHDDGKTETVEQGPDVPIVDGVPGAFGEVETRGGADTESSAAGPAAAVEDNRNA